ncbi:MAG: restriction endonuclease subunit S [Alphaproteobacteria bacterium]|nr:MAG: restriction endonuclease subunit S [Alphaproteobacteria bacterium]
MKTVPLGDHVEILSGFAFKSERFNNDGRGLPLVRIRDVKPATSQTYYDGEYDRRFLLSDGDLLVGMDGEFNCARWAGGNALLNQRVCRVRAVSKFLYEQYLFWFLPKALKDIEQKSNFVTVKHLSAKQINEIEIPLPPMEEQKRIAAILDQADELRRKRQRALDRLNQLGQAIFIEMFGRVGSPRDGSRITPLDEICDLVRGSSPRPQGDPRFFGGPIPRLMIADISRDGMIVTPRIDSLTEEGATKSRPMPAGSVVMAVSGAVGLPAILAVDACIHDGFVGFRDLRKCVLPDFFYWYLVVNREANRAQGAGAIWVNLTTEQVKRFAVPVPKFESQLEFASRMRVVLGQSEHSRAALQVSERLFTSLQHRAFRGELTASSLNEAAV